GRPAVGRRRLRDRLRRVPDAGRPCGRHVRPAPHVRHGAAALLARLAARRQRPEQHDADRRPCDPGFRRSADGGLVAGDHHLDLPCRSHRHRRVLAVGAAQRLGGAAGVLFGGIITEAISWRWVLLINVPLGILAAFVAFRVVSRRAHGEGKGFDALGAVILTSGLLILAYGGVTAGDDGWGSASALVPLAIGNVVLAFFPLAEKRAKAPLVPQNALTPQLKVVNLVVVLFSASIFPMWYIGSLYLQQVLALSPVQTGLTFLPMALAIFACASQAGKLVSRAGVSTVLGGGLILMAVGMGLLARIQYSGHS